MKISIGYLHLVQKQLLISDEKKFLTGVIGLV